MKNTHPNIPNICLADKVRANCAIACGSQESCLEPPPSKADTTLNIYNRINRIVPPSAGGQTLCVREGVDVVAKCRALNNSYPGRANWATEAPNSWYQIQNRLRPTDAVLGLDMTDCDALQASLNRFCSFPAPSAFLTGLNDVVVKSQEFT